MLLAEVLGGEGLVGEAHVHDRRRMARRAAQVDEPAFGQDVQTLAVDHVLDDVLADLTVLAAGQGPQRREVDLDVEVARVGQDRAVAHDLEVLGPDDVDVAGGGDEDVAPGRRLADGHDQVAVHQRLEGPDLIDLDDATWAPMPRKRDAMPLPHQP